MKAWVLIYVLFLVPVFNIQGKDVPFTLTIVPESKWKNVARISLAKDSKRTFYVVLANGTGKTQVIFEDWNSWGYQEISFQIILPGGNKSKITKRDHMFTMNVPSTYEIPPNGYQVFPITFNEEWNLPRFSQPGQTIVALKAIYSLGASDQSRAQNVWVGTIESKAISVELNHW